MHVRCISNFNVDSYANLLIYTIFRNHVYMKHFCECSHWLRSSASAFRHFPWFLFAALPLHWMLMHTQYAHEISSAFIAATNENLMPVILVCARAIRSWHWHFAWQKTIILSGIHMLTRFMQMLTQNNKRPNQIWRNSRVFRATEVAYTRGINVH